MKFQLVHGKAFGKAKDENGQPIAEKVGTVYEAKDKAEFDKKYPHLVGKVKPFVEPLEVATPKAEPSEDEIKAELKAKIKDAGGNIPKGNASIETLTEALKEATEA